MKKPGIPVSKNIFNLQKNSLLHKWSQVNVHAFPLASQKLQKIIAECEEIAELAENDCVQFIHEQLEHILKSAKGRRYSKNVLIFASQLLCTSTAAYRLLRNSCCVILPQEKIVRDLMNKSFQNEKLWTLFDSLKHEQRLVNVLFGEVKLKSTMRYSNSHVVGHSSNRINELATHALVVEIVCHFGGPRSESEETEEGEVKERKITYLENQLKIKERENVKCTKNKGEWEEETQKRDDTIIVMDNEIKKQKQKIKDMENEAMPWKGNL